MRFHFLNVTATAQALLEQSDTFRAEYSNQSDAERYLKKRAGELFAKNCSRINGPVDLANDDMYMALWRNVGVTFSGLGSSPGVTGEESDVGLEIPGLPVVEVNMWVSLPL